MKRMPTDDYSSTDPSCSREEYKADGRSHGHRDRFSSHSSCRICRSGFSSRKATFTTNLYSKQVDSLSSILNELVRLGDKLNSLDDLENPLSVDLSSPKIKELSELNEKKGYEKQYAKLVLTGTLAIMPDHVLGEVADAFEDSLKAIKLLPTAFGPNSTVDEHLNYHVKTESYLCDIASIRFCASEQFKDGMTLHGKLFSACAATYKSTHKSDCYD